MRRETTSSERRVSKDEVARLDAEAEKKKKGAKKPAAKKAPAKKVAVKKPSKK